jgi:hypothetical protein
MCELCNGTGVVHDTGSFGYRTSCCPVCGPESDVVWRGKIESFLKEIQMKKEAVLNGNKQI